MNAISRPLQTLADCARSSGVVGAGGGGFSLADKLLARTYNTLIINAAQSEPLICKDWAALAHYGECVLSGAQLLIDTLGLSKAFLATRDEFSASLPDLPAIARQHKVTLARLPDIYPLGYEKILKREILGIPVMPAGTPASDGVLVVNAETLRNLSWAMLRQRPVCTKLITVAGEVAQPISLSVPIGTSFADCLALAGGATCGGYTVFHNGVLSGQPIDPAQAWVSATTLGYVLLPATHSAAQAVQAGNAMSARLATRRQEFLNQTLAGRTQAMSAAYALFDLTAYRRARPLFRAPNATHEIGTRVRITPAGHRAAFQPCVQAGERVERGQAIAVETGAGITVHASVGGVVESADAQGIALCRDRTTEFKEAHS